MKFTLEDHQELGNRMHRTLNQYKPIKVSPSRKTTIHLEIVRAMLIEKLQEKAKMSKKTASSKAGSEIEMENEPVSDNSPSSKPVSQKEPVVVAQMSDPVVTPSTLSPASSDRAKVTNPESKVESTVSSNATHIHYCDQPKVQVLTADMLSCIPRKMPSAASIHLQDTPNQLWNTATSSVMSHASTIGTGVHIHMGSQNAIGKSHFSVGTPVLSNITTKACLTKTDEVLPCSSLANGKMENKTDAKTDSETSLELPVVEQKFTVGAQPNLINVTKLQEEKDKNKTTGVEVKNKLNENLIAVQTVNEQKCVYDWDRKKNVLIDKKERGHILEGDAKDLSKSEGMVNRPKPKPYPNPRSGITLRLKGNGPRPETGEVIVIDDFSDEDEDH